MFILIFLIVFLLYVVNFKEKESYNGTFVKVGDNIGYIYKAI